MFLIVRSALWILLWDKMIMNGFRRLIYYIGFQSDCIPFFVSLSSLLKVKTTEMNFLFKNEDNDYTLK